MPFLPSFRLRLFSAALLGVWLAGCATPPKQTEREMEVRPEAQWTALKAPAPAAPATPAPAPVPPTWLAGFGDETLLALVKEGLARNYDLRAVAQTLEATRAAAVIAGADRYPQIGVGLNGSGRQFATETAVGVTSVRTEQYDLGLNLSWEIDVWGRLRDRTSAALADVQAAEADLDAARLSLAGQIARAWFRTSSARLLLALAEETVRSFDSTADLVRSRFETGVSTSLELRLALANASAAHALLQLRTQELDAAVRALEAVVGRYPANRLATVDVLPALAPTVPSGLPSELLGRRPDVVAAERRLATADVRVVEARKALLPTLRLTGAAGTASEELGNLLDRDFEVWSIAAGLAQPIFQGGRLRAGVDRSAANAERANAAYLSTVLNAFREVETALAAEETLRVREANLAESAEHSAGAERLARDEYEAGLSDIITVLESQRRSLDARSSYLSVREQRLRNRVDLHLALGGDFAPATGPAATLASAP